MEGQPQHKTVSKAVAKTRLKVTAMPKNLKIIVSVDSSVTISKSQ
jgi:hypothetical protein